MRRSPGQPGHPFNEHPGHPRDDHASRQPTRVYLTIDVECSPGGVFSDPEMPPRGYDLQVWGRFNGQPRGWGIGFIMEELERHDLRGTFFVEAFGGQYFGRAGLAEVCAEITGRGHDVQLHLHPGMLNLVPGADEQVALLSDCFHGYDLEAQTDLLRRGLATLLECGARPPVAFRAGNFAADATTWTALRRVGLPVSSNYNLAYIHRPDQAAARRFQQARDVRRAIRTDTCRLPPDPPRNDLFNVPPALERGSDSRPLLELPITCIRALGRNGRRQYRHLAIPALSAAEMIQALRMARRQALRHVAVILHSFDFVRTDDARNCLGRPITAHVRRFRKVCEWLARNTDAFEVVTVADLAAEQAGSPATGPMPQRDAVPKGSLVLGGLRQAQQLCTRVMYG